MPTMTSMPLAATQCSATAGNMLVRPWQPTAFCSRRSAVAYQWLAFPFRAAAFSPDGRTLVFASTRPGGAGAYDLWLARRGVDGVAWDAPAPLVEINSPGSEYAGWISADRCRIYFSSDRDGGEGFNHRLYVAERPL